MSGLGFFTGQFCPTRKIQRKLRMGIQSVIRNDLMQIARRAIPYLADKDDEKVLKQCLFCMPYGQKELKAPMWQEIARVLKNKYGISCLSLQGVTIREVEGRMVSYCSECVSIETIVCGVRERVLSAERLLSKLFVATGREEVPTLLDSD